MSTLYITDLDGTLLSPQSEVTPQSARMLNEAIRLGARFTVATARTPATVWGLMRDVRMDIPAVVMTGAALWHPADNLYTDTHFMDAGVAREIMGLYREAGLSTFLYTLEDNLVNIRHFGPMSDLERTFLSQRDHSPFKRSLVPEDGESDMPDDLHNVLLLYAMQPSAPLEELSRRVRETKGCNPIFYHDIFGAETGIMEIFSPEATKANAARRLADTLGCDRIVAFGDNVNDLPLLRMADVAVAVANAIPEVKDEADIVIGPNSDDSVAKAILELGMRSASAKNLCE